MPLRTETYDLAAERDDLVERCEEARERLAELREDDVDEDSDAVSTVASEASRCELRARALHWALEEWDVDEVTLGGLTAGEYARIEDDLGGRGGAGAARTHTVAAGTVEAPYVDDADDHDERVAAVAELPVHYVQWARARIDELTAVGNGLEIGSSDSSMDGRPTSDPPSTSTT